MKPLALRLDPALSRPINHLRRSILLQTQPIMIAEPKSKFNRFIGAEAYFTLGEEYAEA